MNAENDIFKLAWLFRRCWWEFVAWFLLPFCCLLLPFLMFVLERAVHSGERGGAGRGWEWSLGGKEGEKGRGAGMGRVVSGQGICNEPNFFLG